MRTSISLIFILFVLVVSCKKNPATPAPVTPASITIASISPAMPYADDEITITGTGFNPDKTKDTVDFGSGDPASGNFTAFRHLATEAVVISASSTQLVIKPVLADSSGYGLNIELFNFFKNTLNRIRVRSNGVKSISGLLPFKQLPDITITDNSVTGPSTNVTNEVRPNDSVLAVVKGITSNNICDMKVSFSCSNVTGCTFSNGYLNFNGTGPQCECDTWTTVYGCTGSTGIGRIVSYNALQHTAYIIMFIKDNFFNTVIHPGGDPAIRIKMKIENADGKFKTRGGVSIFLYPKH